MSSTEDALRLARQAEETGQQTLERLNSRGDRLRNTERNLDRAASQDRIAREKIRELRTLNKSMFAVHFPNPLKSTARHEDNDDPNRHYEQDERDELKAMPGKNRSESAMDRNLLPRADRAKYHFEADSEDDELEDQIDAHFEALSGATGRLRDLADAISKEVTAQDARIERVTKKVDQVDDRLVIRVAN